MIIESIEGENNKITRSRDAMLGFNLYNTLIVWKGGTKVAVELASDCSCTYNCTVYKQHLYPSVLQQFPIA